MNFSYIVFKIFIILKPDKQGLIKVIPKSALRYTKYKYRTSIYYSQRQPRYKRILTSRTSKHGK